MDRPNIIFILSDQQRWDTLGCYGQPLPVTPNLDALAARGVLFKNAFTCQPVCGPARACLQTGRYATATGCYRNDIALPPGERTLAHWLAEGGYEVGYLGKWHLASGGQADYRTKPVPPERRGGYKDFWLASDILEFTSHSYDGHLFDAQGQQVDFPPGRYRADALTDFALEHLTGRKGHGPFFLFISFIEPHFQNDHQCFEGPRGSKERFADFIPPGDLAAAGAAGNWRREYPDYLGCCASLDQNVGRIERALEDRGLDKNTLLIYTSDHGCHFKTRNSEYKRSCHESSIRVPLIIKGPGFGGGKVVEELVSLIDLPPTVLGGGGIGKPSGMQGRPLQELVDRDAADWPEEVFLQISESQVARAIRTKNWKYCVWGSGKDGWKDSAADTYVEECLYDLRADPHELSNLVLEPSLAAERSHLATALKRRMVEAGEKEPVIRTAQRR